MINSFTAFRKNNLTKKESLKALIYIALGIFQSILDLLAFSLIIPIVTLTLNSNILVLENEYLNLLNSIISRYFSEITQLFLIIFGIFLLKYLLSLFINYFQIKYSNDLISSTRSKLISKFLNIDFKEIYEMKSSIISNGIIISAEKAIEIFYINFLILIQSIFHVFIFLVFLSTISLKITLFIGIICSLYLISYYFLIRKKINIFGKKKYDYHSSFVQSIQEIYNGFHIIKLFDLEKKLYNLFKIKSYNYGRVNTVYKILINFPKYSKEMILLSILIILYFFMKYLNYSNDLIINYITVFSIIGIRLFPYLLTIFNMISNIKHSEFAMNILNQELKQYEQKKQKSFREISINECIEFKNISYSYNKKNKQIFNNLNFKISKGEIIGIFGENGTGKSTFFKILSSLIKPQSGEIFIDNNKIQNYENYSWKKSISYVEQNVFLFNDTLLNNITLKNDDYYEKKRLNEIINGINLINFVNEDEKGLNRLILENNSNISGGEKQKIAICRSLYKNSNFILFDESLSNIDEKSIEIIKNYLKQLKNKGIIIISHNEDILSMCDKTYFLKNQKFEE